MLVGSGAYPLGPAQTQTTSKDCLPHRHDAKQERPLHRDSFKSKQLREIHLLTSSGATDTTVQESNMS